MSPHTQGWAGGTVRLVLSIIYGVLQYFYVPGLRLFVSPANKGMYGVKGFSYPLKILQLKTVAIMNLVVSVLRFGHIQRIHAASRQSQQLVAVCDRSFRVNFSVKLCSSVFRYFWATVVILCSGWKTIATWWYWQLWNTILMWFMTENR